MAEKLPPFSGSETVKKLEKAGWKVSRQKGSHVMVTRPEYLYTLSIPQHKELGPTPVDLQLVCNIKDSREMAGKGGKLWDKQGVRGARRDFLKS